MFKMTFDYYNADQIDEGNNKMLETLPLFKLSLAMCPKTNPDFDKWYDDLHNFRSRDDYKTIWESNYKNNKSSVDDFWHDCLHFWNLGKYWETGIYYAYVLNILTKIPTEEMTF